MNSIFPPKLKAGDTIRVIAPSCSMGIISESNRTLAVQALKNLGLSVTFGKHVDECDIMRSSSVESRLQDLHDAFADPDVRAILTVIGGHNSNQLLDGIDYNLISRNPKILCGFSDITALSNAIYHKTSLVTYSGVHFSSFAMQKGFEYTQAFFKRMLFESAEILIEPSLTWSDDAWFLDQENRVFHENQGYWLLQPGEARGHIVGGNLSTLLLLHGTPYMPSLNDTILFLEADSITEGHCVPEFDRAFQSLIQQPDFNKVKGIVIGRFEEKFGMDLERLTFIIESKPELKNLPIIANADFGHTTPIFTFPIGGTATLHAETIGHVSLAIEKH